MAEGSPPSKAPTGIDESVCHLNGSHNPFDEDYGVSCLRENLTSGSYGEGLETGRDDAAPALYPTSVFQRDEATFAARCQSRDFDAQIAHVTTCGILYPFLAYLRRIHAYESLGALFEGMVADLVEKNLAQRLWDLFEDMLRLSSVRSRNPDRSTWHDSNVRRNMPRSKRCLRSPSWAISYKLSISPPRASKWNREKVTIFKG